MTLTQTVIVVIGLFMAVFLFIRLMGEEKVAKMAVLSALVITLILSCAAINGGLFKV